MSSPPPSGRSRCPRRREDLGLWKTDRHGAGNYWWSGVANTYFWIDPDEELFAFAWTQFQPFGRAPVDRELRRIVYEAIEVGR